MARSTPATASSARAIDLQATKNKNVARTLREIFGTLDDAAGVFAAAFESSPVGMQLYDAAGHSVVVNDAFRRLFGSEPPPEYCVLEDDVARAAGILGEIQRAFRGDVVTLPPTWYDPRELRQVQITEGRRVGIRATFIPTVREGVVKAVVVVFVDVTAELLLRPDEDRDLLKAIIEQSGDGIVVCDAEGVVRVFNPAAQKQHGVGLVARAPEAWQETWGLFTEDGAPLALESTPLHRALRGEKVDGARWLVRRPDGALRHLTGTATPLRNPDGSSAGAVLVTRDETERLAAEANRRRAQEDVARSEALKGAVLETALDAIVTMDAGGKISGWNPASERIFGWSSAEAIGREMAELIIPVRYRAAHRAGLGRFLATREANVLGRRLELSALRRDGSEFPVELAITALFLEGVEPIFTGHLRDITDRRRAEAQRAQLLEEAQSVNRLKDEFLATVSHELRTPLHAMLGWARLLRSGTLDAERSARAAETIERNVEMQTRLVEDLLDFSRIVTGKLHLEVTRFDLRDVLRAACETVAIAANGKRITLAPDIDQDLGPIEGDSTRLQQVFWNLLSNAVKFTPAGGRVDVRVVAEENAARIVVADSGQGIAPEFLPYAFEAFRQADSTSTRSHGGLGLGLAIVRKLVELHGGSVRAESDGLGRGSRFIVSLPLCPLDSVSPAAARPSAPGAPSIRGLGILVVDDDGDARAMVGIVLEQAGAHPILAASSREGLAAVAALRPRVILCDLAMPGDDGFAFLRQLRALPDRAATTPVIALTAYARPEDERRVLQAGFQTHVAKPAEPAKLIAAIASVSQSAPQTNPVSDPA